MEQRVQVLEVIAEVVLERVIGDQRQEGPLSALEVTGKPRSSDI